MATFTRCAYVEDDKVCISAAGHRGRHALRDAAAIAVFDKENPGVVGETVTIGNIEGGEMTLPPAIPPELAKEPSGWTPDGADFINLKGKAYLPARRRIQWMRGLPVAHPEWTIDTEVVTHEIGKLTRPGPVGVGRVEGGYAVVRASIYDEAGRLIATGLKSEYSENFTDYLEKAETGAIARALAVAGYGTESALDLDEGVDAGRIADAPVEVPSRSVVLGPSSVPEVGRGGKTNSASVAQIREVASLSKELSLGAEGLVGVIDQVMKGKFVGTVPADEALASKRIAEFLANQTGEDVGALIVALSAAADAEADAAVMVK